MSPGDSIFWRCALAMRIFAGHSAQAISYSIVGLICCLTRDLHLAMTTIANSTTVIKVQTDIVSLDNSSVVNFVVLFSCDFTPSLFATLAEPKFKVFSAHM